MFSSVGAGWNIPGSPKADGPWVDGFKSPSWAFCRKRERVMLPLLYCVRMYQFSMSSFWMNPFGPHRCSWNLTVASFTSGGAALSTRMYDHISVDVGPCGCRTRMMRPTDPMLGKICGGSLT